MMVTNSGMSRITSTSIREGTCSQVVRDSIPAARSEAITVAATMTEIVNPSVIKNPCAKISWLLRMVCIAIAPGKVVAGRIRGG